MSVRFAQPSSQAKSVLNIQKFAGCDLTNSPGAVRINRSPNAVNMIRDVPGKVCKMPGYETIHNFGSAINACFFCRDSSVLVHTGTTLYKVNKWGEKPIYLDAVLTNTQSCAVYLNDALYIFDSKNCHVWKDNVMKLLERIAKIPVVTIANLPSGTGQPYEQLNLLTPTFAETFVADGTSKLFCMSYAPLDDAVLRVEITNADRSITTLYEGVHFSVNRRLGQISFVTAPAATFKIGEPNVKIFADKTVAGYRDRVLSAKVATIYGTGGAQDRIFAGASNEFPGRDYFSAQNDGTFFGDMNYCEIGTNEAIVGYSQMEGTLVTYKNSARGLENIVLREGGLKDNKAAFAITGALQGPGLVNARTLGYLEGEPLYLSREGVMAVTRAETIGTRYMQGRSYYLNGELLKNDLQFASAAMWNDFYVLAVGDKLWMLDGLQPTAREQGMPWSTRQYEGYVRNNCPATLIWEQNSELYFGTRDGRICRFRHKGSDCSLYYDDAAPVNAHWDIPDFGGKNFYKNKTFTFMSVILSSAPITGINVTAKANGVRRQLFNGDAKAGYFSFAKLCFSKLSFRCDDTPRTISARIRLKKVDKAGIRLENNSAQPFGISEVAIEFAENGNYK